VLQKQRQLWFNTMLAAESSQLGVTVNSWQLTVFVFELVLAAEVTLVH